ncbi:MAG: C69 family dipeptidase [Deltaproteobacteria bacterium]|nr:C69 family dipeptidase [Deltaproteobacteria bacterium]
MTRIALVLLAALSTTFLVTPHRAHACTSIGATRAASADGSTMVTYAADSHELYGALYHLPGGVHLPGTERVIHEWDTGTRLGAIPEVPRTWSVIGNMNEHQLVIGETTFGGRKELIDPKGGLDYGSLIYLALQRARTAREAIRVMTDLVERHGYRSKGESFTLADPKEVWLMEMIGRGPDQKGALWVARRVPDGMVTAHANHSRIRTFPLREPDACLYAKDVISFAREKGWFKGHDSEFSFSEAYAPVDADTLRTCELRVWRVFDRLAPSRKIPPDFVKSTPNAPLLPLWVAPDRKVTPQDLMAIMRDHFEGTDYDLTRGVGAGPFALPYRWRPLNWKVDGKDYLNDRAIATQQTGFVFVSQSREALPGLIGGLLWFGVDDAASSVFVPIYAGIREVPKALAETTATLHRFSWDSAFWLFNWVANSTYGRYSDMIQDVHSVQQELEGGFLERQPGIEKAALHLHGSSPELARDYLTAYSHKQVEQTMARWKRLGEDLLVKYMDGNIKDEHGKVLHPPYPESWYRRIVAEDPERYLLPPSKEEPPPAVACPCATPAPAQAAPSPASAPTSPLAPPP